MIQFKEKSFKQGELTNVGLFDYPILMAADILLYEADFVPVGEDQRQHLELARDIAHRFNRIIGRGQTVLKAPNALIPTSGARVMSLTDGYVKMSKSDPSDLSRINLLDEPDVVAKKIRRCKTDSGAGLTMDDPSRPESHNLLTIYQIMSGKSKDQVVCECSEMSFSTFKSLLTETVIEALKPIQTRFADIMNDQTYITTVLKKGRQRAEQIAEMTLSNAQQALGLLDPL